MKKHNAYAVWNGSLKEGSGTLTTDSKVFDKTPYTFSGRFEDGTGTNPDELIAAANAGCYAMFLSAILGKEGITPESLDVHAVVTMDAAKLELTGSHLILNAKIPNISSEKFLELANFAKDNCPISKSLSIPITLEATLA